MKLNKKSFIGLCALLVFIVVGVSIFFIKNLNNADVIAVDYDFTIVAEKDDNSGVDINSGFIITSNEDYPLDAVKKIIKIEPSIDFDITKKSAGNYYLKTKATLNDNSIYNIYAVNENEPAVSWAFQTKADFKVTSTLPADKSNGVPINTGIEIMFSKIPTDIQNYFSISPTVKGKFEILGKKVCFIPSTSLNYNTEYTLRIASGFKAIDESVLEEDYTFTFITVANTFDNSGNIYTLDGHSETFSSKDTHLIELYAQKGDFSNEKFYVTIYNLETADKYLELLKSKKSLDDVTGLNKFTNFETNLVKTDSNSYYAASFILFPENLPTGWYLADVTTGLGVGDTKNQHIQKLIQVTDISVYMQSKNSETVVWCNDVTTGLPISNANVDLNGIKGKTNENGVAIIYISEEKSVPVLITAPDGKKITEYLYLSEAEKNSADDLYYVYFYTDREVYLPTDTVNFWGVILPKKSNAVVPKSIDLSWRNDDKPLKVTVGSDGTFSGKLEFSKLISDYYRVNLLINNYDYYAKSIEISEYVKPTYILSSKFDKEYYKAGDTLKLDVTGKFFDGTPAEALQLKSFIQGIEKNITLDNLGSRTVNHKIENTRTGWNPYRITANVYTTGNDEDASTYNSALYFPTNYMFEAEWKNDTLSLEASKINYNAVTSNGIDYSKIKGETVNATGTISIIKNERIRTETGEYYDYINRVTKKKYDYNTEKTTINTLNFSTNNRIENVDMTYSAESNVWYTAEITYTLPDGFVGKTIVYKYFDMSNGKETNEKDYKYYSFSCDKDTYATKDEIAVSLMCNYDKTQNEGKLLYVVSQDNIKDIAITQRNEINLTFTENYIPNVIISGAYFDGTRIYPVSSEYLYFNNFERELNVKITTNKASYKPGETVTMNIETYDKFGKTYPTKMVMSIVDEAAFSIGDQYVTPLSDLYSYKYYYINQYMSYEQHTIGGGGEGGGEGDGEGYRSDFKDTAAFITITTGSNGKTTASFKVPDNLTSWRITAIGITDNLRAGSATKNISVGLPFFINQVVNEKYTSKDSVVFTARISGTEKNNITDKVNYTAVIEGDNYNKTLTSANSINDIATFDFGELVEGEYEVSIKAVVGNYSDGIKKKIFVYDSLHEIDLTKKVDLSNDINVNALRFPVSFVFYDIENSMYYNNIKKILDTSWGSTNEQRIARNIVYNKLNELNGEEWYTLRDISNIQDYSGGAKILSYSSEDVLFTAKLCALAPEYIDIVSAKGYFERIINNSSSSSSEISAAYFGLAALKEPVLNDIKYLLNNNKSFSTRDNINLISGLACIGDINSANEWYVKALTGSIKEEGEHRYISIGNNDETYEATSGLIIPLAKMNHPDLLMFMNYILETESDKYTPAFDLTSYVNIFNPKTDSKGYLKYKINDNENKIVFNNTPISRLVLNENELKNFKITEFNNVECTAFYVGGIADVVKTSNNKVIVQKTLTGGTTVGDTVTATIRIKFPSDSPKNTYYTLSDIVPSGMRYTGSNAGYDSRWYLMEQELQKLYFRVYNKDNSEIVLSYTTRNLLPGQYYVDSAVIENYRENSRGYSETSSYIISEN